MNSQLENLAYGQMITVIIVVINIILKTTSIKLITWIGYDTHSEMITKITNGVFIAQFFNTAILILLVNANFAEFNIPFTSFFNGPYLDYTYNWYGFVGNRIVQTMIINALMPLGTELIPIITKRLAQRKDQNWEKDRLKAEYVTKTTQIYQYIDLYSGPEYIVHFKYSGILNITYVTMMYGLGLPILFPIAAFSYFVFFSIERYQVAYTYQMPPTLDDKLTKNAL